MPLMNQKEHSLSATGVTKHYKWSQVPVFDVGLVLADFGISVDFHAQVITRFLPVHFTIGYAEQILYTNFIATGEFKKCDTSGCILLFTNPVRNRVICWTPGKIADSLNLWRIKILINDKKLHTDKGRCPLTLIDFLSNRPKDGVS